MKVAIVCCFFWSSFGGFFEGVWGRFLRFLGV